jgi:hypothetical protein
MKIYVLGAVCRVGGAGQELAGAVALWRQHGIKTEIIPTWDKPEPQFLKIMEDLGCTIHNVSPRALGTVDGIAGSTVVCFCNDAALRAKHALGLLKCRLVFAPLMCFLQQGVRNAAQQGWIHDWVFQSQYQKSILGPQLMGMGYTPASFHMVNGYIDWQKIPFHPLPHVVGEPFVMGRAARPRAAKWTRDWWLMYGKVPNPQAILLGPDDETIRQIGRPPKWAEVHKPGTYPTEAFYPRLHATVTCNDAGGDQENAPRITLESFAHGVAMVAENRFGFREQVQNGVTGLLGDTPIEIGQLAAKFATDEELRMSCIREARKRLETELSNPDLIWEQWRTVLGLPAEFVPAVTWNNPAPEEIKKQIQDSVVQAFSNCGYEEDDISYRQRQKQETLYGQE